MDKYEHMCKIKTMINVAKYKISFHMIDYDSAIL